MPVPLIKTNPATAQRVAEAGELINAMALALAPAVRKASEEMGRSFAALKKQRPE